MPNDRMTDGLALQAIADMIADAGTKGLPTMSGAAIINAGFVTSCAR